MQKISAYVKRNAVKKSAFMVLKNNPIKIAQLKGEALKRRMKERGVNQSDFARAIKYDSRDSIRRWWKGERWPQELEPIIETTLLLPQGFFQRIGSGRHYDEALSPFASSRLAPPALRAVGDVVSEPHVYELVQQGGEHDMEGGKRYEAEELGRRVREALLMEPANPDVARVLRRHQDTLKGSVEALTELIFRVGKPAVVS